MASLYELINAELEKNKSITYNRLDEFITDDKRSAVRNSLCHCQKG